MENQSDNNSIVSSEEKKIAVIEVYSQLNKEVSLEPIISFEKQF